MFHHDDASTKKFSNPDKKPNGIAALSPSHQPLFLQPNKYSLGGALSQSKEDLALCFFYQQTLENLVETDHARYLHEQLPTLFPRCGPNSALRLATVAIAFAVWSKSRQGLGPTLQCSRKRYVDAIGALNNAICDPREAKSDETLYAVLMLGGYEVGCFMDFYYHGLTVRCRPQYVNPTQDGARM